MRDDRVALFIDGRNLFYSAKAMGLEVDYAALRRVLVDEGDILFRAYYFNVLADDGDFEAVMPLLDYLEYNGFTVCTRTGVAVTDNSTGQRKVRGNVCTDLAVKAMAMLPHYDTAVLVSGDGDLELLAEALAAAGKRVVVVSTIKGQGQHCADQLRRLADHFVDLDSIKQRITRTKTKETVTA